MSLAFFFYETEALPEQFGEFLVAALRFRIVG